MYAILRHQKGTEAQSRFVTTTNYLELNPSPSSRAVGTQRKRRAALQLPGYIFIRDS